MQIKIHKLTTLPVVLYRCEILFLTLRKAHKLPVFENELLQGIFGPKSEKVTEEWRKLHIMWS
jgi:hypothetical protein